MRKILFFITIFSFLFISLPIFAIEAEKIYLNTEEEKKIKIENVSRFVISDPNVLNVNVLKNEIILKGLRSGKATVYLWQNEKLSSYLVSVEYVQKGANNNKGSSRRNLYRLINPNSAYGIYSLSSAIDMNIKSSSISNQYFYNNLMYKIPVDEHVFNAFNNKFTLPKSEINFNANNIILVSGFSTLNKLTLQNINANLINNLFNINIGDFSISNNMNSLGGTSVGQLRGLNLLLKNKDYQYNIFSGFEVQPFSIYSNNVTIEEQQIRDNFFSAGLSGNAKINDSLSFSGSFLSKQNLVKQDLSTNNLTLGTSINLPKELLIKNSNSSIQASVGTNFLSHSFQISPSYKYKWDDINQTLGIGLSYSYLHPNYSYVGSPSRGYISLSSVFTHPSQLTLSASGSIDATDTVINKKNATLSLSKSFFDGKYSFYISENYLTLDNYARNNILLGNRIIAFDIPFSLEYQYTNNISNLNQSNNLNFGTNSLKLNVSSLSFGPFDASLTSQGIYSNSANKKNLNVNVSTFINYNITNFSKITLNGSYNMNIINLDENIRNDLYSVGLQTSFNIAPYHKFFVNMNIANNLFSPNNNFYFRSNIGYTLEFGREYEKIFDTGDIKGIVYEDSNNNQIFDGNEKIIQKAKVFIDENTSSITDENGYRLKELEQKSKYYIYVDKSTLPEGYKVTTEYPAIVKLNSKLQEVNFGIRKQVIIKGNVFGNKAKTVSLEGIQIIIDNKETITTDISGSFEVKTEPGEHIIMVMPTSIPVNYAIFENKILRKLNIQSGEGEVSFIFLPMSNLTAKVYITKSENKIKELAKNINLNVTFKDDKETKEKTVTTDENGEFVLKGLEEGELKIDSPLMKEPFIIKINDKASNINIELDLFEDNEIKKLSESEKEELSESETVDNSSVDDILNNSNDI